MNGGRAIILLPWRVRKVISDHLPLLYHVVSNLGVSGNSAEYWDKRLAESWDVRSWPTKTARIQALTRPDEAILDIGCGTGTILRSLAERGYTALHGQEISDYACRRLQAEGVHMFKGSLKSLAAADASFDVVIASQVLEHVVRRRRFLEEIDRVLKPGGRAFIFVPDDCLGPIDECEHVVKFTATSLRSLLSRTFDVESLESMQEPGFDMGILFAQLKKRPR